MNKPGKPSVYKPTIQRSPAPPVYRPQPVNIPGVQLKPVNTRIENRPLPAVYRPVNLVQPSLHPPSAGGYRLETRPAPPVYRPQGSPITQPAVAFNSRLKKHAAPMIHGGDRSASSGTIASLVGRPDISAPAALPGQFRSSALNREEGSAGPAPPVFRPAVIQQKTSQYATNNPLSYKGNQQGFSSAVPAPVRVGIASPFPGSCLQRMKFDADGNRRWTIKVAHNTENEAEFDTWIKQLEVTGDWAKLQKIYTELNTHGKSFHTLKAASQVKRILVRREEATTPTAAPLNLNNLQIRDLPKDLWWKLFIDRSKHRTDQDQETNALRFDRQQSPGFYNMMMSAFEAQLSNAYNNPQPMNFQSYDAYHVLVTRGAVRRTDSGGFEAVPHELSGAYTTFPMTQVDEPDPQALLELINEGVAGMDAGQIEGFNKLGLTVLNGVVGADTRQRLRLQNDLPQKYAGLYTLAQDEVQQILVHLNNSRIWDATLNKFAKAAYATVKKQQQMGAGGRFLSRFTRSQVGHGNQHQVNIRTDIPESSTQAAVNQIFTTYRLEVQAVNRDAKLKAICKAVRALHVGHFFADANGRLNTMLLLNQLLMEQAFSPSIVSDNSLFGGSKTLDQLVVMVKAGMDEFKTEVRTAHGIPLPVAALLPLVPVPALMPGPVPAHGRQRARSLERARTLPVAPPPAGRRRAASLGE
jgi:hypothetical protein